MTIYFSGYMNSFLQFCRSYPLLNLVNTLSLQASNSRHALQDLPVHCLYPCRHSGSTSDELSIPIAEVRFCASCYSLQFVFSRIVGRSNTDHIHYPGYTTAQLIAAINDTVSIPILTNAEISQTLFHCSDILGTITGNSYCFAGCDSKVGTRNDQCIM